MPRDVRTLEDAIDVLNSRRHEALEPFRIYADDAGRYIYSPASGSPLPEKEAILWARKIIQIES